MTTQAMATPKRAPMTSHAEEGADDHLPSPERE